jgi:archaellum biogenesis ATPase FlaH
LSHLKLKICKNHIFKDAQQVNPEEKTPKCERHDQLFTFYCNTCTCLLCQICLTEKHKKHDFSLVDEAASKKRSAINEMVKSAQETMIQVSDTIGYLETELKTNEEYKSKIFHEIETRGQEVIDMVKNATEAMIKIVNEKEYKEKTRILDEIGQCRDACSHDTVIISKANETTNGGNAVTLLASGVDIETKLKCSKYVGRRIKEVQQTRFQKSSGTSKEVETFIGSLTDQEDKDDHTKHIRTIHDIKVGDIVRLKMGFGLAYGGGTSIRNSRTVGEVINLSSRDDIYVDFRGYCNNFRCKLDEIEFAT